MSVLRRKRTTAATEPRYPGRTAALDGGDAVVAVETAAGEAAGAYPITPSTQMGEGWARAVARGATNVNGRRLLFFEPEGEHAAAGVTAGMSMAGLRATNFSSGQGIAYMHESLYAAAGKRLTYVLNVAARAMTKQALNVHAGHDDYHAVDDTGFFQLFAKDVQGAADLNLIAHRVAELALNPGLVAQDGFLTSHVIETLRLPEPELVREYLGDPADMIESPTPAQRVVFGERRRRIPELFDVDYPAMLGVVQNQDAYAQGVAAQRPFYFDHIAPLTDEAMAEFFELTGRRYARAAGYRIDDADWVLLGQGSVVANAEAVADHLRRERGLRVGVVDMTMFRPFPADRVTRLLRGRTGVTVLERLDQPLSVDPPLLREVRAAMSQALENGRAADDVPFPGIDAIGPDEVPDFYSAGFGFGSRDLQPGDLVAAVENMLPDAARRRRYYLGVDFIRRDTKLPKLRIWQERLLESYAHLPELALESAGDIDLLPEGSTALRIHSIGGWGAITTGKNLALTAFELAGLHVKANPKYGSEKKGQPTTFYAVLAHEPVRTNGELRHVDVVLSPDPNVFGHSDPLHGLAEGGAFVIQSDAGPDALWRSLPAAARRTIRDRNIRVYALDGFRIATEEASDADLRYRMQGAAFMGAFFAVSSVVDREGLSEDRLFEGIRARLATKFGKRGERVVEDNLRVIRRGYDELRPVPTEAEVDDDEAGALPVIRMPDALDVPGAAPGFGNPGRFFEQVCALYAVGDDGIADPFAAVSAIPAATSAIRDMTDIRFEVPEFVPELCTGCNQCWTQCPDSAIPGLVSTVEDLIDTAIRSAGRDGEPLKRMRQIARNVSREAHKLVDGVPFDSFGDVVTAAYRNVADRLDWDAERRAELDAEFARAYSILADFRVAKTGPFWDVPERREKGSGGLLSITINPEACKGCNICVDVCPEDALVTVKQDGETVDRLRRDWAFWQELPDTDDRYINIASLEEGIGVLPSLLLKKRHYQSMAGGDGACMGCGEKTTVHLVVSAIEAMMQPRVEAFVDRLDRLIDGLDARARGLLSADADLDLVALAKDGPVDLPLEPAKKEEVRRLTDAIAALRDLRWRYTEGPGGGGRAALGITNSTGCSSVWGSTYPYNPYPFPWVNHLFQDAPSIAIGLFDGHMRKMADAFTAVRRAELLLDGRYDPEEHEPFFEAFDWEQFTDEEFGLCPPIVSIGGDGAMLDIGFQNLSRLMASGKPIRVVVLDTQVYSNTGGQASTGSYTGQAADMAPWGEAQHGKREVRKELALIALAHRGVYVHQSSQASASHLMSGVLRGLQTRRPAVFNIYTPCPVEHGLADEAAPRSARLALESRAFPFLTYDPDAGESMAERLSLDGNPSIDARWPRYELRYVDDDGAEHTLDLPVTIADWAATEARFRKHFRPVPEDASADELVPFHEYLDADADERRDRTPFIHTVDDDGRLRRMRVSSEMVTLAEERQGFWSELRELAGIRPPDDVRDHIAAGLESEFDRRAAEIRAEYEAKLAELHATYPQIIARRLAEGLVRNGGDRTVAELLQAAESTPGLEPVRLDGGAAGAAFATGNGAPGEEGAPGESNGAAASAAGDGARQRAPGGSDADGGPSRPGGSDADGETVGRAAAAGSAGEGSAPAVAVGADDALVMEPYIDTELCTTCDECIRINNRMFEYDENKQAYIADPAAGTFKELVQAAERCTAAIIHPGTPLDPGEKDLEKWIGRAERFN